MPYGEFHFNSAVDPRGNADRFAASGSNSRSLVEFNEPIRISKFYLKDAEVPLFWCNVPKAVWRVVFSYRPSATGATTDSYVFEATAAEGCYTGAEFALLLQTAFRAAPLISFSGPSVGANPPVLTTVVVTENDDRLQYVFPPAVHVGHVAAVPTDTHVFIEITVPVEHYKLFSYPWNAPTLASSVVVATTVVSAPIDDKYPLRMVPNYIYMHSSLMADTPFFTVARALGMSKSRTIMARIPIDMAYEWQSQVMPWINPAPDSAYMFTTGGDPITRIEFWFTDESGTELNFQSVNFSLTLGMFY